MLTNSMQVGTREFWSWSILKFFIIWESVIKILCNFLKLNMQHSTVKVSLKIVRINSKQIEKGKEQI